MHISRAKLEGTFRAMSTSDLVKRLHSGKLLEEAQAVAQAELKLRGASADLRGIKDASVTVAPPRPRRRAREWLRRLLIGGYLAFQTLCFLGTLADPPSNLSLSGSYSGMVGLVASEAAGFPLSLVVGVVFGRLALTGGANGAADGTVLVYLFWLCAAANVILLLWFNKASSARRKRGDA